MSIGPHIFMCTLLSMSLATGLHTYLASWILLNLNNYMYR